MGISVATLRNWEQGYLRHIDEVETYLAEREAEAERIREELDSRPENKALREKLLAHRERRS
jgi:hypothetical protein